MDWFTADLHLGHKNIIKHCKRPFVSQNDLDEEPELLTEVMDKCILKNINKTVMQNDRLFINGDFAWWGCSKSQIENYRSSINCKNVYLIIGNHDEPILEYLRPLFVSTEHLIEIKVNTPENPKQRIIMCHYAMRTWNQSHRKSFHLYGHSHHNLPDDPKSLSFDVGIDGKDYNFSPINLDQIRDKMSKKQWVDPFKQWEKDGKLYRKDSATIPEHD